MLFELIIVKFQTDRNTLSVCVSLTKLGGRIQTLEFGEIHYDLSLDDGLNINSFKGYLRLEFGKIICDLSLDDGL